MITPRASIDARQLSHLLSLTHTQTDNELLCVMYEAYLVKGDRVLPASCHGGSLLPSLWHSFSLSLSGGEAGRVREGSKKKIQKYEEMACKRKKAKVICRDRDTGEESEETKPKNNRTCESAGGWVREGDESINTKTWKCFTLDTVMLSSHFT